METQHYAFVLVIDSKFWSRLVERQSQDKPIKFFVRRNAVGPMQAERLLFYVEKPRMQVLGAADFAERIVGDAEDLWSKFGEKSFFESAEEYRAFVGSRRKMTFIRFENFEVFANPKPKDTVNRVFGSLVWFRPKYLSQVSTELLEENTGRGLAIMSIKEFVGDIQEKHREDIAEFKELLKLVEMTNDFQREEQEGIKIFTASNF